MRYDFKDEDLLQITDFCCEGCLTEDIIDSIIQLRKYESIEIYAKAELIEELIGVLHGLVIDENEIKFGMITFDGQGDDYCGEYCLSIDDTFRLWCEPAYRLDEETGEYILFDSEATLAYVFQEDCEQNLIEKLEENDVPTLLFGFDE